MRKQNESFSSLLFSFLAEVLKTEEGIPGNIIVTCTNVLIEQFELRTKGIFFVDARKEALCDNCYYLAPPSASQMFKV